MVERGGVRAVVLNCAALLMAACGDGASSGGVDTGSDAAADAANDAAVDTNTDATPDANTDAAPDAGVDGAADGADSDDGGFHGVDFGTLADPNPGEWPMFKRDLAHAGLADDMTGDITAANRCVAWEQRISPRETRANGGVVVARVGDVWTVFVAATGNCNDAGEECTAESPGTVWALRGDGGDVLWQQRLPGRAQADPYAPLLADVDSDGARELIVPNNRRRPAEETPWDSNAVYAFRTQTEPGGGPGSLQWTFRYDDDAEISEGAPTAYDLYPDDTDLEIVIGSDNSGGPARVYLIDGGDGTRRGSAFSTRRRSQRNGQCTDVNKIDSGSAAIAVVGGRPVLFVGGWDGYLYGLEWRPDGDRGPGLYERFSHPLPESEDFACNIAKIRNSPAVAQLVPGGDEEVVFGYMYDASTPAAFAEDFTSARVRVLSANGLELVDDLDFDDWKSSPSVADFDSELPGLEVVAGRVQGFFALGRGEGDEPLAMDWERTLPELEPIGNRSSPAIGDIDDDGQLELVVGVQGGPQAGLLVLNGADGETEWRWEAPAAIGDEARGIAAGASLGDIDGDGRLEVVFLGLDGVVYALDSECD